MKSIVFIIFLMSVSVLLKSQEPRITDHRFGQSILSFSPTVLLNTPKAAQLAGGIKFQLFLGKRFSIDADIVFSRDYLHLSPAIIGVPLGLFGLSSDNENSSLRSFFFSVAALALSLEHLSYHLPVSSDLDLSPFLSLLRYKIAYDRYEAMNPDFVSEQFSFASGLQLNKYYRWFVFSPYAEYNIGYRDHKSGINAGIFLGIYFRGKQT
jgi:hypothetical protein